jgi:hypothetical protein
MRREREIRTLCDFESWESWISEKESGSSNFAVLKTVVEKEVALL